MKRIAAFILVAALCGAVMLTGCTSIAPGKSEDGRIHVVTTIFPPYDFVRNIAGDKVELTMLLPPGSESHSFEPTPQDIITIQNCDIFVYVGGESDTWVEGILDSMDTSDMWVLSMMEMVDVLEEEIVEGMQDGHDYEDHDAHEHDENEEHDDHDHDEPELDEHVWTSPPNAARIVRSLATALCNIDSENVEYYEAKTSAYLGELSKLHDAYTELAENLSGKPLVFGDRFPFRYLAAEYGFDYYAAFPGCSTDSEPSAATVAFLIDKVREDTIPVVFHIEFNNGKLADTIAEETGAQKLELHSAHNVTRAEIDDGLGYVDIMWRNLENLKEALG